ncbi:MAG: hypothetical protein OEW29_13005 [Acidimicrobiia bacterium]|nr:hypothetical protein [Acidimicrobiia bacterium]
MTTRAGEEGWSRSARSIAAIFDAVTSPAEAADAAPNRNRPRRPGSSDCGRGAMGTIIAGCGCPSPPS